MRTYLVFAGGVILALGIAFGLMTHSTYQPAQEGNYPYTTSTPGGEVSCGSPFSHSYEETRLTTLGVTSCQVVRPTFVLPMTLIVLGILIAFAAAAVPDRPVPVTIAQPQGPPMGPPRF